MMMKDVEVSAPGPRLRGRSLRLKSSDTDKNLFNWLSSKQKRPALNKVEVVPSSWFNSLAQIPFAQLKNYMQKDSGFLYICQ